MNALIEVEENGEIRLPARFHSWGPHTQLQVGQHGEKLVVEPYDNQSLTEQSAKIWNSRTAAQRAAAFREFVANLPRRDGPEIPDEALRRENLYD